MEKEEIFVSKFRALVGTVKNRIASSEKGTVAFARFYKSYLLETSTSDKSKTILR